MDFFEFGSNNTCNGKGLMMSKRLKASSFKRLWLGILIAIPFMGGCRLFSGEVACRLDRDCPADVMAFCTSYDGGLGVCTSDEEYRGNYIQSDPDDAGQQLGDGGPFLDAGASD